MTWPNDSFCDIAILLLSFDTETLLAGQYFESYHLLLTLSLSHTFFFLHCVFFVELFTEFLHLMFYCLILQGNWLFLSLRDNVSFLQIFHTLLEFEEIHLHGVILTDHVFFWRVHCIVLLLHSIFIWGVFAQLLNLILQSIFKLIASFSAFTTLWCSSKTLKCCCLVMSCNTSLCRALFSQIVASVSGLCSITSLWLWFVWLWLKQWCEFGSLHCTP